MLGVELAGVAFGRRRPPSGRATSSRGRAIVTGEPVRRTTTHLARSVARLRQASSTVSLSGTSLPRRQPPSAVITSLGLGVVVAVGEASALKPPKMIECVAPMRAQASMAITSSRAPSACRS
jgi:hypothetical protein